MPGLPHRLLRCAALVAAAGAVAAAPASAATESASSGKVKATFTYKSAGQGKYTNLHLVIRRAGGKAFALTPQAKFCAKPYCVPAGAPSRARSVKVTDLDGDGDPEVVVDLYTGGAHCCTIAYVARFDGTRYVATTRNFADFGYRLTPPSAAGQPSIFTSGDARFAYTFTSFADSAFPIQLSTLVAGRWKDVTRAHADLVTADAAKWMAAYLQARDAGTGLGVLAAWVADEYLLGQASAAETFLASELAAGRLKSEDEQQWPSGSAYLTLLHKSLKAWGYGAPPSAA